MKIAHSLLADQGDTGEIRHGRERHHGALFGGEFYQPNPFFFTREGATLNLVGQYRGAAAFLVAGGPSFREVDSSQLERVWTMTLNNATASYRGNASCIVDDPSRFSLSVWLDPRIQKFVPATHFEKKLWDNRFLIRDGIPLQQWKPTDIKVGDCPNVVGYRRNEKFHAPRWLYEDTVNWGDHSKFGGGRSVMLASMRILFLMGFRRVYLVGVDFEMDEERRYHFDENRTAGAIRGNRSTYAKLQKRFHDLQPHFLKEGFVVKNCNPLSKLTAFPFISFSEAMNEATAEIGYPGIERTSGMYQKREEKLSEGNHASVTECDKGG